MWRVLAVLILLAIPMASADSNEFAWNTAMFAKEWDLFLREYFGCPQDETNILAECMPQKGTFNNKQFSKVRALAKKVFDFKEEK